MSTTNRRQAEAFHPSIYIKEEMEARGWDADDLVDRMGPDRELNRLALDMYLEIGPDNPGLRIGEEAANEIGDAFGVPGELFLNMERIWLASQN